MKTTCCGAQDRAKAKDCYHGNGGGYNGGDSISGHQSGIGSSSRGSSG